MARTEGTDGDSREHGNDGDPPAGRAGTPGDRPAGAVASPTPGPGPGPVPEPVASGAAPPPPDPEGWEEIVPGVLRRRLPGWDATVGLVVGPTGATLVDTGAGPSEGAALRRSAERAAGVPVRHVVLTHSHFDHLLGVGGLPGTVLWAAAGARDVITGPGVEEIGADAVRHGLDPASVRTAVAALVTGRWEWREVLPSGAEPGPGAPPSTAPLPTGTAPAGRRVVAMAPGPAHTGHDLSLLVTGAPGVPPVVFCGDVVEESGEPQAGPDAHPDGWPDAIDRLLRLGGADARYVPGHGAVVDAAFLRAQRAALAARFKTPGTG